MLMQPTRDRKLVIRLPRAAGCRLARGRLIRALGRLNAPSCEHEVAARRNEAGSHLAQADASIESFSSLSALIR